MKTICGATGSGATQRERCKRGRFECGSNDRALFHRCSFEELVDASLELRIDSETFSGVIVLSNAVPGTLPIRATSVATAGFICVCK